MGPGSPRWASAKESAALSLPRWGPQVAAAASDSRHPLEKTRSAGPEREAVTEGECLDPGVPAGCRGREAQEETLGSVGKDLSPSYFQPSLAQCKTGCSFTGKPSRDSEPAAQMGRFLLMPFYCEINPVQRGRELCWCLPTQRGLLHRPPTPLCFSNSLPSQRKPPLSLVRRQGGDLLARGPCWHSLHWWGEGGAFPREKGFQKNSLGGHGMEGALQVPH